MTGLLAWQAFAGLGEVWLLDCLVAAQSAIDAVNFQARRTFMPRRQRRNQLPAGSALESRRSPLRTRPPGRLEPSLLTAAAGRRPAT